MKKVRIKNYLAYPEYEGQIGEVVDENPNNAFYAVKMSDGKTINPYKETVEWTSPQCELVEEEEAFPEKWWIDTSESEVREMIKNWLPEDLKKEYESSFFNGFNYPNWANEDGFKAGFHTGNKKAGYTEITPEQFKKHVLNKEKMSTSKKIIGWKIKEKFNGIRITESIQAITGHPEGAGDVLKFLLTAGDQGYATLLRQAGVLDLWLDPIYEEEKTVFKIGDLVKIKDTENVRRYNHPEFIGSVFRIDEGDAGYKFRTENRKMVGGYIPMGNRYEITFREGDLELASEEELTQLVISKCTISSYAPDFSVEGVVNYGCQRIKKSTIEELLDLLDNSTLDAGLTIKGEKITSEMLHLLLLKM